MQHLIRPARFRWKKKHGQNKAGRDRDRCEAPQIFPEGRALRAELIITSGRVRPY